MVKNSDCKLTFKKFIQMIAEIKNESNINDTIAALEQKKVVQKQRLIESFEETMYSLKPANLIKSVASNVMMKPSLKKGLLLTAGSTGVVLVLRKILRSSIRGRGLLLMALSGAGTMLAKKIIANVLTKTIKVK